MSLQGLFILFQLGLEKKIDQDVPPDRYSLYRLAGSPGKRI